MCRKFENGENEVVLQQKVPHKPKSYQRVSSSTPGGLGVAKTSEKIEPRFHWPRLREDAKLFISWCPECQKRLGPHKKDHHSVVEWQANYPFNHIGIDFMELSPLSNGSTHFLVTGDHFTKCYEAIPLQVQTTVLTLYSPVDHWISRFGCPHSLQSDEGRNFEQKLFEHLMQLLEMDKTRAKPFHPQSNAVPERMIKTKKIRKQNVSMKNKATGHSKCLTL